MGRLLPARRPSAYAEFPVSLDAWRRSVFALLLLVPLGLLATPAAAQSDRAAAEALFKEGRKAMKARDYAGACPKLAESLRLDSAPGTLLNLAECEEKLGKLASAWQRFEELRQTLEPRDKRHRIATRRAAELEQRVPRLTIVLAPGAPASVEIALDGMRLSAAAVGVPLPADPGDHVVVVSAAGRGDARFALSLAVAEKRSLQVGPGPENSEVVPHLAASAPVDRPARAPVDARAEISSSSPTLGYVIGGVGAGAIVASLVVGAVVLDRKATIEEQCSAAARRCTDEGFDAVASGRTLSTVATVSFAGGAVLLGVGAYLVLSHDGGERARTTASARPLPGGGLVEIVRRF